VTFQIGIVATDGVILASDKCARHRAGMGTGTDGGTQTPKIFFPPEEPYMAYCLSGDFDVIGAVFTALSELRLRCGGIKQEQPEQFERLLHKAATALWEKMYGPIVDGPSFECKHSPGSALVAYAGNLFRVNFANLPSANRVEDKTIEGDAANSGAFFIERYWKRMDAEDRTIAKLLPITAHCVLMANRVNPTGVQGLEIAICRRERCEPLTDISRLEEFSEQLDSEIAKKFGLQ
jgi:hypothetical protein